MSLKMEATPGVPEGKTNFHLLKEAIRKVRKRKRTLKEKRILAFVSYVHTKAEETIRFLRNA